MAPRKLAKGLYYLGTYGTPKIVSCYLAVGQKTMLLESGPSSIVDKLLEDVASLGIKPRELDFLLVTHVHLDHAGGAWKVLQAAPNAKLFVSSAGAKHMIGPSRLVGSATAVLGDLLSKWGGMEPISAERVTSLDGGEVIDLGGPAIRVLKTDGHAPHHISAYEEKSKSVLSGDAIGIYYREIDALVPACAPPSFDLPKALASMNAISNLNPRLLLMPHYGVEDSPQKHLRKNIDMYHLWENVISRAISEHGDEQEAFEQLLESVPSYVKLSKEKHIRENLLVDVRGFMKYLSSVLKIRTNSS